MKKLLLTISVFFAFVGHAVAQSSGAVSNPPCVVGTSGATCPLLNGANTWSSTQTFSDGGAWGSTGINGSAIGAGTRANGAFAGLSSGTPVSGLVSFTMKQAGSGFINMGQVGGNSSFSGMSFGSSSAAIAVTTWSIGGDGTSTYVNALTGGSIFHRINNADVLTVTSTGAAITGTLTASAIASNTGVQSGYLCYNTTGGVITYDGTNTCLVSSMRFKDLGQYISPSDGLATIEKLKPVAFTYKDGMGFPKGQQEGFFAEDVAKADPSLAVYFPDGSPRSVKYDQITAKLTAAVQALKSDNDRLTKCMHDWKCRLFGAM